MSKTKRNTSKKDEKTKSKCRGRVEGHEVVIGEYNEMPLEDQLFPEEKEALEKLKNTCDLAKKHTDRYLLGCLMSRKLDIDRTVKMLENLEAFLKKHKITKIPKLADLDIDIMRTGYAYNIPNARSKDGYGVLYFVPRHLEPGKYKEDSFRKMVEFMVWQNLVGAYCEGNIDMARNGIVMVEDLKGFTMKNMDMKFQQKIMKDVQETFPMRVKKILILNPPVIMKILFGIAKLFMKKKLMKRIEIVKDPSRVLDFVDKDQLHVDFGGTLDYSIDEVCDFNIEYDKRYWAENGEEIQNQEATV